MTKKNLAILSLGLVCASFAQDMSTFLGSIYAMEDMSLPTAPGLGANQKGFYFWTPADEWYFKSSMTRVPDAVSQDGNGYVSFVSTHNEACYHPVGVSFGSNGSGTPFTIDMSGVNGDTVSIEMENRASEALRVRITLKDDQENMIDTKAGTPVDKPWTGAYEVDIPSNTTVTKKFSYKGGFYAEWKNMDKCNLFIDSAKKSLPCGVQHTDLSKIAGTNITINSTTPEKTGITNAELRIHKMSFGAIAGTARLFWNSKTGNLNRNGHLYNLLGQQSNRASTSN